MPCTKTFSKAHFKFKPLSHFLLHINILTTIFVKNDKTTVK